MRKNSKKHYREKVPHPEVLKIFNHIWPKIGGGMRTIWPVIFEGGCVVLEASDLIKSLKFKKNRRY